jgi:predicted GIY-YIG superfamily endonuclease
VPIDGCHRSFDEIAHIVLPNYMAQLRNHLKSPIPMADFAINGVGPVKLQAKLGLDHDPRGCYVLLDQNQPVYVGISKHIITRLRQHVRGTDHLTATLVYRIAASNHPHGMTAAQAMKDSEFQSRFEEARQYLLSLYVSFVEIDNPLELYLFEPYCALELDTGIEAGGWNTFETH